MKTLMLSLAAALALAIAGPALASMDDYPELWAGTQLAATAAATTEVAAAPTTPCPPQCQCPHMTARADRAMHRENAAGAEKQVAKAKQPTWAEIIPYNY